MRFRLVTDPLEIFETRNCFTLSMYVRSYMQIYSN